MYLGFPLCERHVELVEKRLDDWYDVPAERAKSMRDIKVDYSQGIDKPQFYRKCKKCKKRHGPYAKFAEAQRSPLCPACDEAELEMLKAMRRKQ
jgi:hypothetical protein